MWSPWSTGSPQKTCSFALSATSFEIGTSACRSFWSGPPSPSRYVATQTAIQLSMIVVITSCAPTVAFSRPAIPAQTAPARPATMTASGTWIQGDMPANEVPTQTAKIAPAKYCPCPPMLNIPQRNAKATARPVRTSGVEIRSVCWKFSAARKRSSPPTHGKSQFSPDPSKIAR